MHNLDRPLITFKNNEQNSTVSLSTADFLTAPMLLKSPSPFQKRASIRKSSMPYWKKPGQKRKNTSSFKAKKIPTKFKKSYKNDKF
jgi:hypothetical protein